MRRVGRGWVLVGLLFAVALGVPGYAQVALTTVADTVYSADGKPATGTVIVSWNAFTTVQGVAVAAGQTSAVLGADGVLSLALAPNVGATPTGSYYTAVFHLGDGTTNRQYWVVPVGGPVKLAAIENQVLPTSVAMQTVSKAYVDQAIAAAVTGGGSTGTSTGTGTSTASYVQKSGDTMTGPLVLPGDPVSSLQAADKHYVDVNVAALSGGAAQKVSTLPSASQTVLQPAGTQLEVNALNGVVDATGFNTGTGGNGIGNALGSAYCASGCDMRVSQNYPTFESVPQGGVATGTHIVDRRGGATVETLQNPLPVGLTDSVGMSMVQTTTLSAPLMQATRPSGGANSYLMKLTHNATTGGSNQYPADVEVAPYGKSNYSALQLAGNYNTQGQHVQFGNVLNCYAVGDCLAGAQFIVSSGGYRDEADEGAHPFDLSVLEDTRVFRGTCAGGCTTGSTSLQVNATASGGTQGDGRFLMNMNPSKTVTGGFISGGGDDYLPEVGFTGSSFPLSTMLLTASSANSQPGNLAPGTVTLPIATSGLRAGYATSTAALPTTTGVACVADQGTFPNFETAAYKVVDATHLQLTLNKVHNNNAVIAVGGLCGYGLEQIVDTTNGIRQIFPVIGSPTAVMLNIAEANSWVAGISGGSSTGGFLHTTNAIASATRSGNVVTVQLAQPTQYDMNGLSLTISGMVDASYNGTFPVTTTSLSSFTYVANGPDGSSTGGTMNFSNGSYALYPMVEVLSVANPATGGIDGTMTLAANTVKWAAGDPVEEPHYYQQLTYADIENITQFVPRPTQYASAGKIYSGQLGPGARGWAVTNAVPTSNYVGAGGTHQPPDSAYQSAGVWKNSMELDAGTESVLRVHCNLQGCSRWDAQYALLAMDRNGGVEDFLFYNPANSNATWLLGGTNYRFAPDAFTAPNIVADRATVGAIAGVNTLSVANVQAAGGASTFVGPNAQYGRALHVAPAGAGDQTGIDFDNAPGVTSLETCGPNVFPGQTNRWQFTMNGDSSWLLWDNTGCRSVLQVQPGGLMALMPQGSGQVTVGGSSTDPAPGMLNVGTANQFWVDGSGNVTAATLHANLRTPANSSAACSAGDFADDANFHYVCVGTNSWKRVALSAF